MHTLKLTWSLMLVGAVLTAACSDSKSSMNPTAPSAVTSASLNADASDDGAESSATAKGGNGKGNGNGNGNDGGNNGKGGPPSNAPGQGGSSNTSPGAPGQQKVEIEGLVMSVGSDSLTVNGQTVLVTTETVIRHGNQTFQLSQLNSGDRVHVRAMRVQASGLGLGAAAVASLQATQIMLQNPAGGDDGEEPPAPTNLVSVMPSDASASEPAPGAVANPGTFRLTRTGDPTLLASALTVTFTLDGTATNGTDYALINPQSVTFAAGSPTADVVITPAADASSEGNETVVLTLTGAAPYELGSPLMATINISDTVNPLVSVTALDDVATEAGDPGTFRLNRTGGNTTQPLTVTIMFSGSASNGTDYVTSLTNQAEVVFPANVTTVFVTVQPTPDTAADPAEIAILTVIDGVAYDLGLTPSAAVNITGS